MFDSLLKSKFYAKCKSSTKQMKTRINIIIRKRNTMLKYLRNDIADLLRDGLDINAYNRTEGLLVELNLSACYEYVEKFCDCISDHLALMNNQRECLDECREAVSSCIFAAARFADLPELRDLRSLFTEKYASSLDAHVNKEFMEKMKAIKPTKDMKLQLLEDIAMEYGLKWDCKSLEQKLYFEKVQKDGIMKDATNLKNNNGSSWDNVREAMNMKTDTIGKTFVKETETGHVHPNLPDYDAFVKRFAALRKGK
ncbi:IST1-like protein [Impatiens glandulifera]|uniref:IST1-like protein n=1 Tax=Impatiens glandulifera TaxID=253017 RepID=UPI001FB19EB9|nr:IST1-like protein [Impatiens glandulifera]